MAAKLESILLDSLQGSHFACILVYDNLKAGLEARSFRLLEVSATHDEQSLACRLAVLKVVQEIGLHVDGSSLIRVLLQIVGEDFFRLFLADVQEVERGGF